MGPLAPIEIRKSPGRVGRKPSAGAPFFFRFGYPGWIGSAAMMKPRGPSVTSRQKTYAAMSSIFRGELRCSAIWSIGTGFGKTGIRARAS